MSLKDFLLEKTEFEKDTVKVGEHTIKIREMSGSERSEMLKADTTEESSRIAWNACVLDKSEHMDEAEFSQAFKFRYSMINAVVVAICKLSGYFDDDEELEKN